MRQHKETRVNTSSVGKTCDLREKKTQNSEVKWNSMSGYFSMAICKA